MLSPRLIFITLAFRRSIRNECMSEHRTKHASKYHHTDIATLLIKPLHCIEHDQWDYMLLLLRQLFDYLDKQQCYKVLTTGWCVFYSLSYITYTPFLFYPLYLYIFHVLFKDSGFFSTFYLHCT